MDIGGILRKLKHKEGYASLIMNAPAEYSGLPGVIGASNEPATGKYEFALVFVSSRAEADTLGPKAAGALKYDGVLWMAYPRGKAKADISRDRGWEALAGRGLRPMSLVALDDTWSALRFRPLEAVKKEYGYGMPAGRTVRACSNY
ncbi:MAG TPA: hypothetical protein HA257_02825 [Candidatus Methanoperedenaceae archaeon]|nr:hypothetical protein [Candidatus Methanoperedenaceae archaeon]